MSGGQSFRTFDLSDGEGIDINLIGSALNRVATLPGDCCPCPPPAVAHPLSSTSAPVLDTPLAEETCSASGHVSAHPTAPNDLNMPPAHEVANG